MNRFFNGVRRAVLVVALAAGVTASAGLPTANATHVFDERYCGNNIAVDGVYNRSCWLYGSEQTGMVPAAKMRIPSPGLDPNKWTACTVRVAVFRKHATASEYTRLQTDVFDCLDDVVFGSRNNAELWFAGRQVLFQPKTTYYVISRWYGTYNGQPVGISASGPFPKSATLSGTDTDAGTGVVVVPETPDTPGVVGVIVP